MGFMKNKIAIVILVFLFLSLTARAIETDVVTIEIWDASSGSLLRNLSGHSDWVFSVAWSPDGTKIASGSQDTTIKLWNASSGSEIRTLSGHGGGVPSIAWSPDGTKIASGSWDTTIKLWDTSSGSLLRTLSGHGGSMLSVAWSPDGTKIVSSNLNPWELLWETLKQQISEYYNYTRLWEEYCSNLTKWVIPDEIEAFVVTPTITVAPRTLILTPPPPPDMRPVVPTQKKQSGFEFLVALVGLIAIGYFMWKKQHLRRGGA